MDKIFLKISLFLLIYFVSFITQAGSSKGYNSPSFTLEEAYEGYLNAVKARDIKRVKSYLVDDKRLPFVNDGGKLSLSMDDYLKAQETWFADPTWTYHSEVVSIQKFSYVAVIIDKTTVRSNQDGKTSDFNMMVTYVFKREAGLWRIVTDVSSAIL